MNSMKLNCYRGVNGKTDHGKQSHRNLNKHNLTLDLRGDQQHYINPLESYVEFSNTQAMYSIYYGLLMDYHYQVYFHYQAISITPCSCYHSLGIVCRNAETTSSDFLLKIDKFVFHVPNVCEFDFYVYLCHVRCKYKMYTWFNIYITLANMCNVRTANVKHQRFMFEA